MRFTQSLTNTFDKTVMTFRYYRLVAYRIWGNGTLTLNTNDGILMISELGIYATISGSEQEIARGTSQGGGQVYSASSQSSSTYIAAKAFDGNTGTWWQAATTQSGGQWLKVDLGAGKGVSATKFVISTYQLRGVRDFILEGSNDNSEWFMVYDGSNDGMFYDLNTAEFICQPYYSYTDAPAFTVAGVEPQWVEMPSQDLGTLVNGSYIVEKVEAHQSTVYHEDVLTDGTLSDVEFRDLWRPEGVQLATADSFPTIASNSRGGINVNGVITAIALPTGIVANDLVVLLFSKDGTTAPTTPTDWTLLFGISSGGSYFSVFYRVATGTIAGFNVTHASECTTWICLRIPQARIIAGTSYNIGTTVSPKTPTVPWGGVAAFDSIKKRLAISAAGWDYNQTVSAYPTNRPDNRISQISTTTAGSGVVIATNNDESTRIDEATFTISVADQWAAYGFAVENSAYATSGYRTTPAILTAGFPTNIIPTWTSDLPSGTSVSIEYAFTSGGNPSSWTSVSSGDTLTVSNTHLWFKQSFSTTNTNITPTLTSFIISDATTPDNEVLLTMKRLKHFQNVEGNLTVAYSQLTGNLAGNDGIVQSFSVAFTPADLVRLPNPLLPEYITAQVSAFSVIATEIVWRNRYTDEAITVQVSAFTVTVTWVGTNVL